MLKEGTENEQVIVVDAEMSDEEDYSISEEVSVEFLRRLPSS